MLANLALTILTATAAPATPQAPATQAPATPQTPAELLTQDVHAQIAKGDLVNFTILQNEMSSKEARLTYAVEVAKNKAIERRANRATYKKQNGVWVLTQVTPLDEEVQFTEDAGREPASESPASN